MIRWWRTKGKSLPFIYQSLLAIALRRIDVYSLPLIEYLWNHILLNQKWRTKGKLSPSAYRSVSAIMFRMIGGYSLLLIEYLWNHVSLSQKWKIKGESLPFAYREVLAVVLRRVGEYSLSFIDESKVRIIEPKIKKLSQNQSCFPIGVCQQLHSEESAAIRCHSLNTFESTYRWSKNEKRKAN